MALSDDDRRRLGDFINDQKLTLSETMLQHFPDDYWEVMGKLLGDLMEHVMGSGALGYSVERFRFVEAFNKGDGRMWLLNYLDPESLEEDAVTVDDILN